MFTPNKYTCADSSAVTLLYGGSRGRRDGGGGGCGRRVVADADVVGHNTLRGGSSRHEG
jgi:hypothetical protein